VTPFITFVNRYGIMYICISDMYVILCDSHIGRKSPISRSSSENLDGNFLADNK